MRHSEKFRSFSVVYAELKFSKGHLFVPKGTGCRHNPKIPLKIRGMLGLALAETVGPFSTVRQSVLGTNTPFDLLETILSAVEIEPSRPKFGVADKERNSQFARCCVTRNLEVRMVVCVAQLHS